MRGGVAGSLSAATGVVLMQYAGSCLPSVPCAACVPNAIGVAFQWLYAPPVVAQRVFFYGVGCEHYVIAHVATVVLSSYGIHLLFFVHPEGVACCGHNANLVFLSWDELLLGVIKPLAPVLTVTWCVWHD